MANSNVKSALESMKYEVANELGISNYATADKANMTSKQNGSVGGEMVKRMIKNAESQMSGKNSSF